MISQVQVFSQLKRTGSLLDCSEVDLSSPLEHPSIKINGTNNMERYFSS